jgi:translation initiation factor IF-2
MSKVRVYELAKKLNKQSKEILDVLAKLGIEGKTHTSSIEEDIAKKITDVLSPKPPIEKVAPEAGKKVAKMPAAKVPRGQTSAEEKGRRKKPEPAAVEGPSPAAEVKPVPVFRKAKMKLNCRIGSKRN